MSKSPVTLHVLDTARGTPGRGIRVRLEQRVPTSTTTPPSLEKEENEDEAEDAAGYEWRVLGETITNEDGRGPGILPPSHTTMEFAVYRMTFYTKPYFDSFGSPTFYPKIELLFQIVDESHYHIPLILGPYGYTTYRGS